MKQYIVSATIFDTVKEVEGQLQKWQKEGTLREGTMVFEVKDAKVYEPKIKLVAIKE